MRFEPKTLEEAIKDFRELKELLNLDDRFLESFGYDFTELLDEYYDLKEVIEYGNLR